MSRSLRILQINSGEGWSGGQYQVLMLSRGLRERGHHVVVVCPPDSALAVKSAKEGLIVETVPMRGQWDLNAVIRLREIMRRHGIEIVNTHKPKPHTLALMAAITVRIPVMVATRRVSFPLRRHPFRWLKWVAGVDKIIAVAKSVEESLILSGVPAEKVVTIYGAIDLKRFRPAAPDPALRKELGIDEQTWVVGKVADYRPWKGYGIFLEAASMILQEEPNVRFLAVGGKSDYFDEMQAIAGRFSIEKRVTFTGFRDDVERFYPLMHVSVNCATSGEGLPGVLRESLAMEIPVVATDVGGNREVVLDGQTGRLIPSNDPAALAGAILGLLRNPESARRLGQQGRRFVEQHFSIESMVTQTEAVYQSLMATRS